MEDKLLNKDIISEENPGVSDDLRRTTNSSQNTTFDLFKSRELSAIYNHGTIIRTGITCKKVPCYMRASTCRWFIVKKAKIY